MANDELERVKKQLADVMAEGGSYRRLQVQLDAALQKHKDDAAAHEAMNNLLVKRVNDLLDEKRQLQETHAAALKEVYAGHDAHIKEYQETLKSVRKQADSDVQLAQERADSLVAAFREQAAFQVQQYQLAHAEMLAILQESPEARLLRVQQAQEAQELKARQDAARAALANKLK